MALTVTPTDEMKTLKVGEKIYEIVDDEARTDLNTVKADFSELVIDGNNQNLFSVVQGFEGICLDINGGSQYDQPDNIASDYISIPGAKSVTLQTWHTLPDGIVNWQALCFYDSEKNLIGARNVKTGSTDSHVVFTTAVPDGATYVRASSRIFGDYRIMLQWGNVPTAYVSNEYDNAYIRGLSELTYDEFKGYIGAYGDFNSPTSTHEEVFTDPIKCLEGDVIYYSIFNPNAFSGWYAYCFYDADAVFINRVVLPVSTVKSYVDHITIPSGVSYVRFTYRTHGGDIKLTLRGNRRRNNIYQYKLNRAFTKVEHLIPMIPSLFYGLPQFDTVAKTLTIPRDTLLMFHGYASRDATYVSTPETIVDFSSIVSTAIKFYFNIDSKTVRATLYNGLSYDNEVLLCCLRLLDGGGGRASMSIPYYINGKLYGFDFNELVDKDLSSFNKNVKSVNHRGYNTVAPENTLPAYQLSKKNGFDMVETDVSFTSDNVAVLLHDDTINRTARNSDGTEISETISINSITYAEALTYDFGIWKGSAYTGTKIPTFEQFISLCRKIGLHPYIELKSAGVTQSNIHGLVDIVTSYDMLDKVTWISFNATFLGYVKQYDPTARLGVVCGAVTESIITNAVNLKTQDNDVFIDASSGTDNDVSLAKTAELPIEVWGVNTANGLNALDGYVSGATTNKLIFGYELYKANV